MSRAEKVLALVNEAAGWAIGDWGVQRQSQIGDMYFVVIDVQKNGGAKVVAKEDGAPGPAKITSTKNWHPLPVHIGEDEVPKKTKDKILKKKEVS